MDEKLKKKLLAKRNKVSRKSLPKSIDLTSVILIIYQTHGLALTRFLSMFSGTIMNAAVYPQKLVCDTFVPRDHQEFVIVLTSEHM